MIKRSYINFIIVLPSTMSMVYWELILVYDVNYKSMFFNYMAIQFDHNLLKMTLFFHCSADHFVINQGSIFCVRFCVLSWVLLVYFSFLVLILCSINRYAFIMTHKFCIVHVSYCFFQECLAILSLLHFYKYLRISFWGSLKNKWINKNPPGILNETALNLRIKFGGRLTS